MLLQLLLATPALAAGARPDWDDVRQAMRYATAPRACRVTHISRRLPTAPQVLSAWPFTESFVVMAGDATGPLFKHEQGTLKSGTRVGTASTSKWPAAMAVAALVADGTIGSLDDKASKYIDWWTTSAADPRSHVTLRHLLSFTSGFGDGTPGDEFLRER